MIKLSVLIKKERERVVKDSKAENFREQKFSEFIQITKTMMMSVDEVKRILVLVNIKTMNEELIGIKILPNLTAILER